MFAHRAMREGVFERRPSEDAAEQADAADEARLDAYESIFVSKDHRARGWVVRASQLIGGVRQTWMGVRGETRRAVHARVRV